MVQLATSRSHLCAPSSCSSTPYVLMDALSCIPVWSTLETPYPPTTSIHKKQTTVQLSRFCQTVPFKWYRKRGKEAIAPTRNCQPETSILGVKGVATPRFWAGGCGGSWTGLRKYYIVFWTESMLESDHYFPEKEEKFGKNAGVNGSFCDNEKFYS